MTPKPPNKILSTVRLTPRQLEALQRMAQAEQLTLSDVIRRSIDLYLARPQTGNPLQKNAA